MMVIGKRFQCCPTAEYVLRDIAEEMPNVVHKRFAEMNNISCQTMDYSKEFLNGTFDVVVSALSIHHLEDKDKLGLFARIYDILPSGWVFVNYDRFCAGQSEMNHWFDSYWENQLMNSGLSDHDIELWRERRKPDKECTVEKEMGMLNRCKFKEVKCGYSCQKFSVIVAMK